MSSGTQKTDGPQAPAPGLVQALAEGMHALAQPLGVLQGTLEIAMLETRSAVELEKTLETSLAEVERAAGLLGYLQQLLGVCRHRAELGAVDIGSVLLSVVADLKLVFDDSGVGLEVQCPEQVPVIRGVRSRIREALFYALQAAHALARRGQQVVVRVNEQDSAVEIALENRERWLTQESLATDAALRKLTLAQMIILSQQGEFYWDGEPFTVRLSLPLAVCAQSTGKVDVIVTQ